MSRAIIGILLYCILFSTGLRGQQNSFLVGDVGAATYSIYLHTTLDTIFCQGDYTKARIVNERTFFIIHDSACKGGYNKWYVVVYEGKMYLADKFFFKDRLKLDRQLDTLRKIYPFLTERLELSNDGIRKWNEKEKMRIAEEERERIRREKEEEKSKLALFDSLTKVVDKALVTYRTKNWVLWDWSWSYANEYSSFADVSITIINPYKQKIKYLWITFQAFNAVDDIIRDGFTGKSETTVKGIGPIEYGDKGSYSFESVIYSKVINAMKVKQIKIQFFDGTVKVISNPVNLNANGRLEE